MEAWPSQSGLLAGLSDSVVGEWWSRFETMRVKSGESACVQGDACTHLFVVTRGLLQLSRLTLDGREFTLRVARRGDFFGDENMLGYAEYSLDAVALVDSTVAFCPSDDARNLLIRHPQIAINYARCVRENHDCEVANRERSSANRVRHRLLRLLHDLAEEWGAAEGGGIAIDVRLTHDRLGSLIGAQRETVTAALTALAREGEITRQGRKIVLPKRSSRAA